MSLYRVILKREKPPREAWGIDWMNEKAFVSISGSMEWRPYRKVLRPSGYSDSDGNYLYEGDIVDVHRTDSFPSYNRAVITYEENAGAFMLQYTKPVMPNGFLMQCGRFLSEDKTILYGHLYDWPIKRVGNIFENRHLLETAMKSK